MARVCKVGMQRALLWIKSLLKWPECVIDQSSADQLAQSTAQNEDSSFWPMTEITQLTKIGELDFDFWWSGKLNGWLWRCDSELSEAAASLKRCSPPTHRAETIRWNNLKSANAVFGVCHCSMESVTAVFAKNIRHLAAAAPLLKSIIYHQFVDIIPRYDLFGCLVIEKLVICLQYSETKTRSFIWAKWLTAWHAAVAYSACRIMRLLASYVMAYLVNARNWAQSPEQWRLSSLVDFAQSVPSPQLEFSSERSHIHDPWYHMDQLCTRTLAPGRALAAATRRARPRARHRKCLNILTVREPMDPSSRRKMFIFVSYRMATTNNFLSQSCFWALLLEGPKFEDFAFC